MKQRQEGWKAGPHMINNAVNFNENSMENSNGRKKLLMKFTRTYRRLLEMRLMTFFFFILRNFHFRGWHLI